jgi:hypothetical protein
VSTPWNSLFCPSEAAEGIAQSLQESLLTLGYEPYNPFGAFPGKSYRETIKLFLAPPAGGWTRVLGAPDEGQLVELSRIVPCLYIQLDAANARIQVYVSGQEADIVALTPYLRDGFTARELDAAMNDAYTRLETTSAPSNGLPLDMLPDDIQALADKVDQGAAQKMFSRISGQLMNKVGGQADAAHALVSGGNAPDWDSSGGRQIRALMNGLTVPEGWREPDFDTLRDAYALHERRRRSPNARLYPGDEAVMARVPDALAYKPIYGGRNA